MPAAKVEEKGESSTAFSSTALKSAATNGSATYELPWFVLLPLLLLAMHH